MTDVDGTVDHFDLDCAFRGKDVSDDCVEVLSEVVDRRLPGAPKRRREFEVLAVVGELETVEIEEDPFDVCVILGSGFVRSALFRECFSRLRTSPAVDGRVDSPLVPFVRLFVCVTVVCHI